MTKSTASIATALVLLVLSASAAVAAAAPPPADPSPPAVSMPDGGVPLLAAIFGDNAGASSTQAVPAAAIGPCGLRVYSCHPCTNGLELCYTQSCGTITLVHCAACEPECFLPG